MLLGVARVWLVLLGLLLVYGSTDHALSFDGLVRQLHLHEVLPAPLVSASAVAVIGWEWLTGVLCVVAGFRRWLLPVGAVAASALLAGLTTYLAFVGLAQGVDASCGCSGAVPMNVDGALVRNGVMASVPLACVAVLGRYARTTSAAR
jgi:hypothetical protein